MREDNCYLSFLNHSLSFIPTTQTSADLYTTPSFPGKGRNALTSGSGLLKKQTNTKKQTTLGSQHPSPWGRHLGQPASLFFSFPPAGGSSGLRNGSLRRLQKQRHSFGPAFQTRDWCIHLQESTSNRDGPRG